MDRRDIQAGAAEMLGAGRRQSRPIPHRHIQVIRPCAASSDTPCTRVARHFHQPCCLTEGPCLPRLNEAERRLYDDLRWRRLRDEPLRLEQERIAFGCVERTVIAAVTAVAV
jgi:hypothetical protein